MHHGTRIPTKMLGPPADKRAGQSEAPAPHIPWLQQSFAPMSDLPCKFEPAPVRSTHQNPAQRSLPPYFPQNSCLLSTLPPGPRRKQKDGGHTRYRYHQKNLSSHIHFRTHLPVLFTSTLSRIPCAVTPGWVTGSCRSVR